MKRGKVYLVGAGPGNPELITVKGMKCLKKADLVVYDHLIDPSVLNYCKTGIEHICVGKEPGRHSFTQTKIEEILIKKAKRGMVVVRLKGGDPYVLGRGGEEAEALVRNKIEYEVIPGITSAIAVPASAGIPLTMRGISSGFSVVTGHHDPSDLKNRPNWINLAKSEMTLVVLMGMANLDKIMRTLLKAGMSEDTPVAVIQNGTLKDQRMVAGSIKDIKQKVHESGLTSPSVVVVGKVVDVRKRLGVRDTRILQGKTILITRDLQQTDTFKSALENKGALPLLAPVINIRPVVYSAKIAKVFDCLTAYSWIMFSSTNGVNHFMRLLMKHKRGANLPINLKIAAIGEITAAEITKYGFKPTVIPEKYTSGGILKAFSTKQLKGKRVLVVSSNLAGAKLKNGLINSYGASVDEIIVYRTCRVGITRETMKMITQNKIDVITFTSGSTVMYFMDGMKQNLEMLKGFTFACIGPETETTLNKYGFKSQITAGVHTIEGLVEALEKYYRNGGLRDGSIS